MEKTKRGFTDKLTEQVMKISEHLAKLSGLPSIAAIQDGLVACMPILIVGSIFLILYVLGSPVVGSSGKALLPFLTPLALNPFLIVPFLLSTTVSAAVGYLLMATPLFGKFYAMVPWATPPFILGPVGTGDIKTALIPFISLAIGVVIYLPFWRQYEKECMLKESEE